jgi:DNA-binding beta-propeller fold protein YncE
MRIGGFCRIQKSRMVGKTVTLVSVFLLLVLPSWFIGGVQAEDDSGTLAVIGSVPLSNAERPLAVNSQTNKVYFAGEKSLIVVNGETDTVEAEVPVGWEILSIVVNPQINRIYIGGQFNITILDGDSYSVVGFLPDSGYLYHFAVNPVTGLIYAASPTMTLGQYDTILVYSESSLQLLDTVNIPRSNEYSTFHSIALAVNPTTNMLYAVYGERLWVSCNVMQIAPDSNYAFVTNAWHSGSSDPFLINSYTDYVYVGNSIYSSDNLTSVPQKCTGDIKAIDSIHNLIYTMDSEALYAVNGSTHETVASLELDSLDDDSLDGLAVVNPATSKLYLSLTKYNQTHMTNQTLIIGSQPIDEFTLTTPQGLVTLLSVFAVVTATAILLKKRACTPKQV